MDHFSPPNKKYSSLCSFSQKISTGFTPVLVYTLIGGTSRCISIMCPKALFLGLELINATAELIRPPGPCLLGPR